MELKYTDLLYFEASSFGNGLGSCERHERLIPVNDERDKIPVVIIGSGFTGLAAAYEITRQGIPVTVLEKDDEIGGLAGSFKINAQCAEKFYHHWFTNDEHLIKLTKEIGCEDQLVYSQTKTGIYIDKCFFKLSTPLDVLLFKPLGLLNRIQLGMLVLRVRRVKDWKELESVTARKWLLKLCGQQVYKVVWEPLLRGKFGSFAPEISAVWFWNKVVLRGGSRSKTEKEMLAYYRGGFGAFIEAIANEIKFAGGEFVTGASVEALIVQDGRVKRVQSPKGTIDARAVIATPALPIIAELVEPHISSQYVDELRRIKYLANICLVLELSHSLSDIYWLNVTDPDFPFIGIIEHTNFQPTESYDGLHIIYLSQYLPETAELYYMNKEQVFEFALSHIKRMFPKFDKSWVRHYHVHKARYAQPIVERYYSTLIPSNTTPIEGLYIATMAQIYPEDRGTNYSIREGRRVGRIVAEQIQLDN